MMIFVLYHKPTHKCRISTSLEEEEEEEQQQQRSFVSKENLSAKKKKKKKEHENTHTLPSTGRIQQHRN
jgi:hypothetical protein